MYIWTRHDFGPWHGFLCFFLYWMSIVVWFPGAAMFYVGTAAGIAGVSGSHLAQDRTWLVIVSLGAVWLALGANIVGVKTGQRTADAGAIASWLLALLLSAAAFASWKHHGPATRFQLLPDFTWDTVSFWSAIAFAMSGMELVGLMGAESAIRNAVCREPRGYPRSLRPSFTRANCCVLVLLRPIRSVSCKVLHRRATPRHRLSPRRGCRC